AFETDLNAMNNTAPRARVSIKRAFCRKLNQKRSLDIAPTTEPRIPTAKSAKSALRSIAFLKMFFAIGHFPCCRLRMYKITFQRSSGATCAAYEPILFLPIVMIWNIAPSGSALDVSVWYEGGFGNFGIIGPSPAPVAPWQTAQ